jgi:histidine triad (HIT) family protein
VASVFTMIINGDLPGRFVWKDDQCVAFLTINPLKPGHTLVVPRNEVDHWLDLESDLLAHVATVSQAVGTAVQQAFQPKKVGVIIAGLEVPHVHVHLVPIVDEVRDLDFANAEAEPDPAELDAAAARIRAALRDLGYIQVAD